MTVLIEFKTDVFRTALSCFWLSGGDWVGRDSKVLVWFLCFASVCVSLSWVNGERGHGRGLGLCLGECRVSGDWWLFDGGGVIVKSWIKLVELIVLPTDPGVGRVWSLVMPWLNDVQRQGDSCRGWGRDSDRLGQTDVLWFTGGPWVWVIPFGCHVCSMFDSIDRGSKGCWLNNDRF